jgi:dTMP kinase
LAPFIVLEGVEGSGKSTQARLLGEWLAERDVAHLVTREPGGTSAGEAIRTIVLHGEDVPARAELLLMLAARAVFVDAIVEPALAAGTVVIADRFELSTLAYQGYGRGLDLDEVRRLNAFATAGRRADLTVVLDVDPAVGEARRTAAGGGADRIERAGSAFHARVARAYGLLAESEPDVVRLDGVAPPAEVQARLRELLQARFPETFASAPG